MNYFNQQADIYPTEMLETYSKATKQSTDPTDAPETIPLEKAAQIPECPTPAAPTAFDTIPPTRPEMVNHEQDFSPVVGWIVCIDGPSRGKDFPIRAGYNYIGRGKGNDICIPGDMHISGDRHAMIAYSPRGNKFTFSPANGRGIVYVNEEDVFVPVVLKMRDIIEIGSTKFYFIPLCDDVFDWKKF